MSAEPPPYSYPFELASLSERGAELTLSPDADERARIAAWLDILEVPRLEARVRLERGQDDVYGYEAEFTAEVVQACVVTLEPVPATHSGTISRRYHVADRRASRKAPRVVEVKAEPDEEAAEVLATSRLDIAAPLLEELSLVLDPYPRAPGVTFEAPKDEAAASESPFAVLAKLKKRPPKEPEPRG